MKLHLKNFGCWENKIVDFTDTGTNLLSGPSGTGKTSILRAVVFAMYGVGRKIIHNGGTKCMVEMWFDNMHITRTKGPCRLLVSDGLNEYEDAEAQGVINKVFGNMSLCYLEQNGRNTFVGMAPQQKLEFMEMLTFLNYDIQSLKDRLKQKSKSVENSLLELDTRYELCREQLSTLIVPPKPEDIHLLELAESTSVDTLIREKDERRAKNADRIVTLRSELESNRFNMLNEKRMRSVQEMEHLQSLITQYKGKVDSVRHLVNSDTDALRDIVNSYNRFCKLDELELRLNEQQALYDTLVNGECDRIENELERKTDELAMFPLHRKEIKRMLKQIQTTEDITKQLCTKKKELLEFPDVSGLDETKAKMDQSAHELDEYKSRKNTYKCPSCSIGLALVDTHLKCVKDVSFSEKTLTKLYTTFTGYQSTYNRLVDDSRRKDVLESEIKRLETELGGIDHATYSADELETMYDNICVTKRLVEELRISLERVQRRFTKVEQTLEPLRNEKEKLLEECLHLSRVSEEQCNDATMQLDCIANAQRTLDEYTSLLEREQSRADSLAKTINTLDNQLTLICDPSSIQCTLDGLVSDNERIYGELCSLQIIQKYLDSKRQKERLEDEKKSLHKKLGDIKKLQRKCTDFKKIVANAESVAIQATIDTLNSNAQMFLDAFFPDDPMTAKIVSIKGKGTKTERHQINIDVFYKGMNIETTMLSGGEYDRLALAFMLGICEISQSPLVLLDECISSLDQENAETVCKYLRHCQYNRCSILVAHQIISGMFDKVICTV